jgi:hypothetical protein
MWWVSKSLFDPMRAKNSRMGMIMDDGAWTGDAIHWNHRPRDE